MNHSFTRTTYSIIFLFVVFSQLVSFQYAWSFQDKRADKQRERCLAILHEALHSDENFWINVHAAEALIYNVYTAGVEAVFTNLRNNPYSNIVGICRVMAWLHRKNAVKYS